jgi:uncharacterized protein YutE (UPF0331/DUF86 family)
VVLRPDAIRERLAKLEETISRLERFAAHESSPARGDFRDAWAAERGLQLGAEVMFDIGNHILSAHYGVSAQDYEDIIVQLAVTGVIDQALRQRLTGLGGFRNILVHGYLRIDPDRVADHLTRAPLDFSAFAGAVRAWLERTITS